MIISNIKDFLISSTVVKDETLEFDLNMLLNREKFMEMVAKGVSKDRERKETVAPEQQNK